MKTSTSALVGSAGANQSRTKALAWGGISTRGSVTFTSCGWLVRIKKTRGVSHSLVYEMRCDVFPGAGVKR